MTPPVSKPRSLPVHPLTRFILTAGACAWVLAGATGAARAHEYWLTPSRYIAPAGAVVEIGAVAGTGFHGDRKPWSSPHVVRFEARTQRVLDLTRVARNGELAWARLAPSDDLGALLAYESDFTPIELPGAVFETYLASEGLDGPLAARRAAQAAGPGRERYRRCAKAWLSGRDGARALSVVGLPLELVPLASPGEAPRLALRLFYHGRPLAHALVKAWRQPLVSGAVTRDPETRDSVGVAWQGRTDARGEVVVPVAEAGEWLVSAVQMVPSTDPTADWESSWASFTFVRREESSPARAAR
jgi:hypothetical protein